MILINNKNLPDNDKCQTNSLNKLFSQKVCKRFRFKIKNNGSGSYNIFLHLKSSWC